MVHGVRTLNATGFPAGGVRRRSLRMRSDGCPPRGDSCTAPLQPPPSGGSWTHLHVADMLTHDGIDTFPDQDGICQRVRFTFTYVMLPWMCWDLLFFCVFHGLWNMDYTGKQER